MEHKRGELARLVNLKNIDLSTLSSEQLYEIALDFVSLVDKNKSGSLDEEEFYDYFSNAADIFLTDEQIRQLFLEFDTSGDGVISLQEFATAIAVVLSTEDVEVAEASEAGALSTK